MMNEIRMLIAEGFLGLAIKVAPNNEEGQKLVLCIMNYLLDKLGKKSN